MAKHEIWREILQASDEQLEILPCDEVREMGVNPKKVNFLAGAIHDICGSAKGEVRRAVINRYGPSLFALASELNTNENELAQLVESLRTNEGGFFEAMALLAGRFGTLGRAIGFATEPIETRGEIETSGVTGEREAPTKVYEDGEYSGFVQKTIGRMFDPKEDKMAVFEQEGPVILAILFVHGRSLPRAAATLMFLAQSEDYAEAMTRMAQDDGNVSMAPAVGRAGYYRVRALRSPLCIDKDSSR